MQIHIFKVFGILLLSEVALYLAINTLLLVKWWRVYKNLRDSFDIVFRSDIRLYEFIPLFVMGNLALAFSLFVWAVVLFLRLVGAWVSI